MDVYYEPPLINIDPKSVEMLPVNPSRWQKIFYDAMKYVFYTGVLQAVLVLPDWLKAPWLNYTISRSNFTAIMEEAWSTRSIMVPDSEGLQERASFMELKGVYEFIRGGPVRKATVAKILKQIIRKDSSRRVKTENITQ